jgi:outer membrane lipoprotein-sorting protein
MDPRSAVMLVCASLLGFSLGACATRLPTYPPMSDAQALSTIAARLDSTRTISASTDVKLTDPQGQTITLDGALVARPPGTARLRAWKLGTPVLDLTILPDGVWAFAASREGTTSEENPQAKLTALPAAGIAQSVELLSGTYFANATPIPERSDASMLVVRGSALGSTQVLCTIDRRTLTPRRFTLPAADKAMELRLSEYTLINAAPFAQRIDFLSPDGGSIVIQLHDIELNTELPAAAFTPPTRATRLPDHPVPASAGSTKP